MYLLKFLIFFVFLFKNASARGNHEVDVYFRVDPGTRTCFFEKGKAGQRMEMFYEVINGQHGELDISLNILDPIGTTLVSDFKSSHNSIILDLQQDGDYSFCFDNSYSLMNYKLVFIYIMMEDQKKDAVQEVDVGVVENDGQEHTEEEIIEWMGTTADGEPYTIDINIIIDSLTLTMNHVLKARQMLSLFRTGKTRDSYLALEDTFVVDVWSSFQILFMATVGLIQVYTIKKLFTRPSCYSK